MLIQSLLFQIKIYLRWQVNKNHFEESFELSNHVLLHGVQSITDLMVRPGLINLDFADVEHVMSSWVCNDGDW